MGLHGYHGGSLMIAQKFDNLTISRFLFYYQKVKLCSESCNEKREILETIIHTLYVLDRSCVRHKGLFGILILFSLNNVSHFNENLLELMIGQQLDQATLDNLLVPSPLKSSHLYHAHAGLTNQW
uniref:NPH3 domain-containing protein n=1 Tax=Brassica campestris TaxID=3711 RepID=A0A3P5ZAJ0_BRACM|nr:unnamed protein product [Brassica rapa]